MTDRAIYTIDLDDAAFKNFAQTFEKFKAESEKIKNTWKANDQLVELAAKNFKTMGGSVAAPAQDKSESVADVMGKWSSTGWGSIGSSAKMFTTNIRSASTMLAKWSGITAVFGSLIAAGGIYGISRIAMGASAKRTSAAGIGTTYSAQEAASAAFVGIPDAGKIIRSLSEATASQNGMAPLFSLMGGKAEGLRGGDPVENFVKILPHLKGMADQESSWGSMGERLRAMGLDKIGVSMETLRLLKAFKPGELEHMIKRYREAEPSMRLSVKDQKALQEFDTVLEESEESIKMLFGVNLVKMVPAVEIGTKVFTAAIEELLKDGGPAADLIQGFGKGIMKFSKWIDTPDIEGQIVKFGDTLLEFSTYEKYGPELKILLSAFAGWQVGGIWGAGLASAVAVGSMWDGPDTPAGKARIAKEQHDKWSSASDRMKHIGEGATGNDGGNPYSHIGGNLKIENESYSFGSGSTGEYAHIPYGNYPITPDTVGAWGKAHDAIGINNNDIYDPNLKRHRLGIELHPGSSDDLLTEGCVAIAGSHWREFKSHVQDMMRRYGAVYLHVGKDGASVVPKSKLQKDNYDASPANKNKQAIGHGRNNLANRNPQLSGQQSHVEVHDDSSEGVHVSVESEQRGPLHQ